MAFAPRPARSRRAPAPDRQAHDGPRQSSRPARLTQSIDALGEATEALRRRFRFRFADFDRLVRGDRSRPRHCDRPDRLASGQVRIGLAHRGEVFNDELKPLGRQTLPWSPSRARLREAWRRPSGPGRARLGAAQTRVVLRGRFWRAARACGGRWRALQARKNAA